MNLMIVNQLRRKLFLQHLCMKFCKSLHHLVHLLLKLLESNSEHPILSQQGKVVSLGSDVDFIEPPYFDSNFLSCSGHVRFETILLGV